MIELAVALPTAAVLGFAARAAGARVGALDRPDATLKPHARAVLYLGGVAVAGGIAAGLASRGWPIPAGVAVAMFAPLALGLADDAWRVPPPVRLAAQVGLGAVMVWGGLAATALPGRVLADGGAVVLYAAALNGVNMVDGLDALAGSVAVASGAGIAIVAATHDQQGIVAVSLAAAAAGFLVHNLLPARLFLGDNGAYLVGAALTVAVLQTGRTVPALAGAAGCLGVFLLDLVLSLARRVSGRVPLHQGDRGHLYGARPLAARHAGDLRGSARRTDRHRRGRGPAVDDRSSGGAGHRVGGRDRRAVRVRLRDYRQESPVR